MAVSRRTKRRAFQLFVFGCLALNGLTSVARFIVDPPSYWPAVVLGVLGGTLVLFALCLLGERRQRRRPSKAMAEALAADPFVLNAVLRIKALPPELRHTIDDASSWFALTYGLVAVRAELVRGALRIRSTGWPSYDIDTSFPVDDLGRVSPVVAIRLVVPGGIRIAVPGGSIILLQQSSPGDQMQLVNKLQALIERERNERHLARARDA